MAQPAGELEGRMTRLEIEVAEVRYLATKADSDGVELRAVLKGQKGLLSALRETQMEHGQMLAGHSKMLAGHGRRLDSLEAKFDRLEDKVDTGFAEVAIGFATVKAGQERITELLTNRQEGEE